jgi:hypothetical protein
MADETAGVEYWDADADLVSTNPVGEKAMPKPVSAEEFVAAQKKLKKTVKRIRKIKPPTAGRKLKPSQIKEMEDAVLDGKRAMDVINAYGRPARRTTVQRIS